MLSADAGAAILDEAAHRLPVDLLVRMAMLLLVASDIVNACRAFMTRFTMTCCS
jgi:hypothetical protein